MPSGQLFGSGGGRRFGSGGGGFSAPGIAHRGAIGAVAVHAVHGGKGAVILALCLGHMPQVGPETGLLLLGQSFGYPGVGAVVMAANVVPEFLVGGAGALPCPGRIGELPDEHFFVAVAGLVGGDEPFQEVAVVFLALVGKQEHVRVLSPH